MRKRLLSISLICLLVALPLAGCSSKVKQQKEADEAAAEALELEKEAFDSNDYAVQRAALIEMHKQHPSEAYIAAISAIPVEIEDPELLKIVENVLDSVTEEEATKAIEALTAFEWKNGFQDDLVGVTRVSVYDQGTKITPLAAAGTNPVSVGLQLRVESNAYETTIKWLDGAGKYRYLSYDDGGIVALNTSVKNGAYNSDFKEIICDGEGRVTEVSKGTFDDGVITGTLTVIKDGKEYSADVTGKNYTVAEILGVEEYSNFMSFGKVEVAEQTLEDFEARLAARIEQEQSEKPSVVESHVSVSAAVSELKEVKNESVEAGTNSGSTNKTPSQSASTNKTQSTNKNQATTNTGSTTSGGGNTGGAVASGGNDSGGSSGGGSTPAAPAPTPDPTPAPTPDPPAPEPEYSASEGDDASIGGGEESGFYD